MGKTASFWSNDSGDSVSPEDSEIERKSESIESVLSWLEGMPLKGISSLEEDNSWVSGDELDIVPSPIVATSTGSTSLIHASA
jgi:hypothetical protein